MFRRCLMLLLVAFLLIGWDCPALAIDRAELYQAAQDELHGYLNGDSMNWTLDELCGEFESLGWYQKSASFLYYTSLLRDVEAERFDQLDVYMLLLETDTDFDSLLQEADFPTVAETEAYARGRMAEAAHDNKGAIAYYQQCGAMLDSLARMRTLLLATPAPTETTVLTTVPDLTQEYEIASHVDGTCAITRYTGNATQLSIPEYIEGYRVTAIGDYAFRHCTSLSMLLLPDSVTSIGFAAFANCNSLISISIPDSVTVIGASAFHECSSLCDIVFPQSAFVGNFAFNNCDSLTSISIPDSIVSMGINPFRGCDSLRQIVVSSNHPTFSVIDDALVDRDEQKLLCYPSGCGETHYTIPQGILIVGERAFADNRSLTSVVIPEDVISIEFAAFNGCTSLTSIIIPDSVTFMDDDLFGSCPSLTLRVPQGSYAHQYAIDHNIPYTIY